MRALEMGQEWWPCKLEHLGMGQGGKKFWKDAHGPGLQNALWDDPKMEKGLQNALTGSNPLCKKISLVGFGSGPRKVAMQRWVDGYLENGYVV